MKVLVNGIGNIGSSLIQILNTNKDLLGIEDVYAMKNSPKPWSYAELKIIESLGVKIITGDPKDDFLNLDDIKDDVDYIFDATNNGGGIRNKEWFLKLKNLKGACAQGSEKNFGVSYMSGLNDEMIKGEKFVHIVSCNTHAIGSLLQTLSDNKLENIENADFVVVRRSEDIGNHERLVSANVVARHLDKELGTHHSIDITDLLSTMNISIPITSSDVTTPSQLMHAVRFNITFSEEINKKLLFERIDSNPRISTTTKFDSNIIFELGRRYGNSGRIYSHSIIVKNNILYNKNTAKGWAFIPQEGNTLLSSINAYLLQTEHHDIKKAMQHLLHGYIFKEW